MTTLQNALAQAVGSVETLASAKDKLMALSDERKAVWHIIELLRTHGPALLEMMGRDDARSGGGS